jgi:predicted aspartyl protease
MRGSIDEYGRALLSVRIAPDSGTQPVTIEAWIDTGFTGDLVLPQMVIDALALLPSGTVDEFLQTDRKLK